MNVSEPAIRGRPEEATVRSYVVALAALVVFVAIAFAGIWAFTRSPGGAPGPAQQPAAAAAPEPPPPAPAPAPVVVLPPVRPEIPPPPLIADPPPPPPPPGSWEAVAPVPRLAAMGPLGGAIRGALNDVEPRISACFDEESQARHGSTMPTQAGDASGAEGLTPVLMLEVETGAGSARIVDAPVDARGGASDGLLSCVQRVLRGVSVTFPAAQGGKRYRVPYAVTQ